MRSWHAYQRIPALNRSEAKGIASGSGFSLIELLLVIGILSILLSVVYLAVNPSRNIAQTNNAARRTHLETIINAIHEYQIDAGSYPSGIDVTLRVIGTGASCAIGCPTTPLTPSECLNLTSALAPQYVATIPTDPQGDSVNTRYAVQLLSNGRLLVRACSAELSDVIELQR